MPHQHNLACFDSKGSVTCVSAVVQERQARAAAERARWKNYIWKVRAGNATIVALPGERYHAPSASAPEAEGSAEIAIENGPFHYRTLVKKMPVRGGKHWQLKELLGLAHYDSPDTAYQHLKGPVQKMSRGHSYTSLPDDAGVSPIYHERLPDLDPSLDEPSKLRSLKRPVIIRRGSSLTTLADVIDSEEPYLVAWEWRSKPQRWAGSSSRIRPTDVLREATEQDLVSHRLPRSEW